MHCSVHLASGLSLLVIPLWLLSHPICYSVVPVPCLACPSNLSGLLQYPVWITSMLCLAYLCRPLLAFLQPVYYRHRPPTSKNRRERMWARVRERELGLEFEKVHERVSLRERERDHELEDESWWERKRGNLREMHQDRVKMRLRIIFAFHLIYLSESLFDEAT